MNNQVRHVFFCAIVVAFGGFIFGLDAALISGTVRFISAEFALSDLQIGAVVSAPGFGVLFALLITGFICDKYGRRQALLIISFLYILSAVASVCAFSFEMLVTARFVGGLAFTSLSVAAMYIGEIAPPKLRGKLVAMIQINIVIGLSAAYFANYMILQVSQMEADWVYALGLDTHTWRWMLGIEIVPAVIWLFLLVLIPRSPRWLVMNNRISEATTVLHQFLTNQEVEKELEQIQHSVALGDKHTLSTMQAIKAMFGSKMRKAALIGLTMGVVQQITGINAIMFYAPTVFEQVGLGTNAAFFQALIVGLVSVLFTVAAVLLVDKLGRRPLVIYGLAAGTISLFMCHYAFSHATYMLTPEQISSFANEHSIASMHNMLNTAFSSDIEFKNQLQSVIGVEEFRRHEGQLMQMATNVNANMILIGVMGYIAAFHFSIGPVMWVLFSEIFPIAIRGTAIPMFALLASIVSYLVQQFFPWQLSHMGASNIFLFYAISGAIGFVILFKIMPETKNKTIEEIELDLVSTKNKVSVA
ncbi:MAG: MFS transporter [Alteromonadaceae bacterium]|uniref:sugar porter family MFS transporter n=1 Tax=Paraglaciecola chathamensis TaxID=368405 RepID=UPI000C392D79|nr:sugar porter family MFS transporter [Paraglaciecola agarilytica]MBN25158.1 MFS transporter [Alteromonadaceae bacterium]|tara:strand:- start:14836 stop:16425 length:1590 start_codon:yes stop_codon:yes gene_type:complete